MGIEIPQQSTSAVVVFLPGNSLMHQMSNWAGSQWEADVRYCFPKTAYEIRSLLRDPVLVLIDATERPLDAMVVFEEVLAAWGSDPVMVYSEAIHEGLELFIRTRAVLLVCTPMNSAAWQDLFHTKRISLAKECDAETIRGTDADVNAPSKLWNQRIENQTRNRLFKSA